MKALIFKNQTVLDSRDVAKMVGQRHTDLLRRIDTYIKDISQNAKLRCDQFFIPSTYKAGTGKEYKNYLLTRQGCEFVANKMTGKKGNQFTAEYVTLFNEMKDRIVHPQSQKKRSKLTNDQRAERVKIMGANSRNRKAALLLKIADNYKTDPALHDSLLAEATETLTGKMTIPFMRIHYYSAGQIGRQLDISANMVGRIANKLHLKAEQPGQNKFGRWATNKSPNSPKEVAQWLYTDEGVYQVKTYYNLWVKKDGVNK